MNKEFLTVKDEIMIYKDDWNKVQRILGLLGYTDINEPIGETLDNAYIYIQMLQDQAAIGRKFKEAVDAANNT